MSRVLVYFLSYILPSQFLFVPGLTHVTRFHRQRQLTAFGSNANLGVASAFSALEKLPERKL